MTRQSSVSRRAILRGLIAFTTLAVCVSASADATPRRPNVVLIVADDLGYGDLSSYGCPDIETPHIDSIAKAGVRFTQAYAYPVCSPARAALLTGKYAERFGISAAIVEDAPKIAGHAMVQELLRKSGYATGLVGKWHLGFSTPFSPTRKGFDEFFGLRGGKIDYFTHTDTAQPREGHPEGKHDLWEGEQQVHRSGYATDLFTARARQFLRDHADAGRSGERPFFLYLAYTAPHYGRRGLWQAPDAYLKRFDAEGKTEGRDVYRAMVACLDDGVGEVLDEIAAQRLDGDTLVIFMSDNGPDKPGSAKPLSGGKFTYREGGIRVPLVARWPGVVPSGATRDDLVHVTDLLPTLLAATQTQPKREVETDGQNVWSAFTGGPRVPDRVIYFADRGMRDGKFKLLNGKLFDIEADPRETTDLSKQFPDVHDRLTRQSRAWAKSMHIEPSTKPTAKSAGAGKKK